MQKRTLYAIISLSLLYMPTQASWKTAAEEILVVGTTHARRASTPMGGSLSLHGYIPVPGIHQERFLREA